MIYILFVLLIALCIFYYIIFKSNILSPSVIACGMFIISTFFAVLNVDKWRFTIAPVTVVVILSSLMAFGGGELLVNMLFYKRKQRKLLTLSKQPISVSGLSMSLLCLVLILLLYNYYKSTLMLAKAAGYTGDKTGGLMLWYARTADVYNKAERGRLASYSNIFAQCTSYIFLYIITNNIFLGGGKKTVRYSLPVIIYIPYIILTAGRLNFILLITVAVILGCIAFMQKKNWNPKYTATILYIGVLSIIVFFGLFVFAGAFRRKDMVENAIDIIAYYTGMSIPLLDDFLLHPRPPGTYFGEHTLFGIYSILRRIGFAFPDFFQPYEYPRADNLTSNVYTAIRRYLEDFGYFGLYSILFSLGFLYSLIFYLVKNKRNLSLILYAAYFYPIVNIAIDEMFFLKIVTTNIITTTFFLVVLYFIFIDKRYLNEIKKYCFNLVRRCPPGSGALMENQ